MEHCLAGKKNILFVRSKQLFYRILQNIFQQLDVRFNIKPTINDAKVSGASCRHATPKHYGATPKFLCTTHSSLKASPGLLLTPSPLSVHWTWKFFPLSLLVVIIHSHVGTDWILPEMWKENNFLNFIFYRLNGLKNNCIWKTFYFVNIFV